jgi:hypothetical protein
MERDWFFERLELIVHDILTIEEREEKSKRKWKDDNTGIMMSQEELTAAEMFIYMYKHVFIYLYRYVDVSGRIDSIHTYILYTNLYVYIHIYIGIMMSQEELTAADHLQEVLTQGIQVYEHLDIFVSMCIYIYELILSVQYCLDV